MKLRLQGITVQDIMSLGSSPSQNIIVRLFVSNAEMETDPHLYPGDVAEFPDIYEFAIDDAAFVSEMLELEIHVINVNDPRNEVVVGRASANLRHVLPDFNSEEILVFNLEIPSKAIKGEVRLAAMVHEPETAYEELKNQHLENEKIRVEYNTLVEHMKQMEEETNENIAKAQAQVDKVTAKYNELVKKYNEIQDTIVTLHEENEKLQNDLAIEHAENVRLGKSAGDSVTVYKDLNDELTRKVSDLTIENEHLAQQVRITQDDLTTVQNELEELYTSKIETELQLNDQIASLTEELDRLRGDTVSTSVVSTLNDKLLLLVAEVNRLRQLGVSTSITYNNTIVQNNTINNTYIQNIINNTSITNIYVNALESPDIEVVRKEFIDLHKKYDAIRDQNLKLMDRLYGVLCNIQVFARTRPPTDAEKESGSLIIENSGDLPLINCYDNNENSWQTYEVDRHWAYDGTQNDVFIDVEPLVSGLLPDPLVLAKAPSTAAETKQSAVLVYGGAGSGKTFTLCGFGEHIGIAFRSVQRVFETIDFRRTELAQAKAKPAAAGPNLSEDVLFETQLSMSIMDIYDDKVVDVLAGGADVSADIAYDAASGKVNVSGLSKVALVDKGEALLLLGDSIRLAAERRVEGDRVNRSTLIIELHLSLTFSESEGPYTAKLSLVDLLPSGVASAEKDPNMTSFNDVLSAMSQGSGGGDGEAQAQAQAIFDSSVLTRVLQGVLQRRCKTMMLFTFSPTNEDKEETVANAELASRVRKINRAGHSGPGSGASSESPAVLQQAERKLKTVTTELKDTKKKLSLLEARLVEARLVSEDYIIQFNDRNKIIAKDYQEEKLRNKQLQQDLELTLRNLKKVIAELQEQKKINERLVQISRVLEKERQLAIEVVAH